MEYFALGVGDILGIPFRFHQGYNPWLVGLGLVIVAASIWVVVRYGVRRDDHSGGPFAVTLIVIGLLFVALITEGRVIFGSWSASASRYTTFELLIPAGIYLALLSRPPKGAQEGVAPGDREPAVPVERWLGGADRWAVPVARAFIGLLIVAQVAVSLPNGMKGARSNYTYQTTAAKVLLNYRSLPNAEVVYYLYIFSNARFIRQQAATLEQHHLNVFAATHEGVGVPLRPVPEIRSSSSITGALERGPPQTRPRGST